VASLPSSTPRTGPLPGRAGRALKAPPSGTLTLAVRHFLERPHVSLSPKRRRTLTSRSIIAINTIVHPIISEQIAINHGYMG
jgi:hypothetical protein